MIVVPVVRPRAGPKASDQKPQDGPAPDESVLQAIHLQKPWTPEKGGKDITFVSSPEAANPEMPALYQPEVELTLHLAQWGYGAHPAHCRVRYFSYQRA